MVCRHAGFKHAADAMFISQSAVSEHVTQLEDYLGEKLLERNNRSLRLTPAGTSLLKYADRIFSESRNINSIFRHKEAVDVPFLLRVGIAGGISRNFLYRQLTHILATHESLRIEVTTGAFQELTNMLKGFELDVLISLEQSASRDLVQIEQHVMGSSRLCLAGVPELMKPLLAGRKFRQTTPVYTYRHPLELEPVEKVLKRVMKLPVEEKLASDDIPLLRFFANSGKGLVILPLAGIHNDVESGFILQKPLPQLPEASFHASFLKQGIYHETIRSLFAG
jgi:LysR family transcriptional activator of nhaA